MRAVRTLCRVLSVCVGLKINVICAHVCIWDKIIHWQNYFSENFKESLKNLSFIILFSFFSFKFTFQIVEKSWTLATKICWHGDKIERISYPSVTSIKMKNRYKQNNKSKMRTRKNWVEIESSSFQVKN